MSTPGSEWRLHRHWFGSTALADLLGGDERLAQADTLDRGRDGLLAHKDARFTHLRQRWSDLFGAKFDGLLYDLTSTYFECIVPAGKAKLRNRTGGESRNALEPCAHFGVLLMVFPQQRHENVDVEQAGHGVRLSSSPTNREVMTPPLARMTGNPSAAVAAVNFGERAVLSASTTKRTIAPVQPVSGA